MRRSLLLHLRRYVTLQNGVLALAGMIVLGSLWTTVATLQRNYVLQRQLDDLVRQVELETLRTDTLALEGQYYRSREYLEVAARDRLSRGAPGEKLVILPPAVAPAASASQAADTSAPSNFQQWMRFFFGSHAS